VQAAGEGRRGAHRLAWVVHQEIIPLFRAVVTHVATVLILIEVMPEARIIKRYANRKLYDTQHSRYVTLDQISDMIRAGDEVKIIDNKTKEDLTSVTLAQIIFEEEKKQKSFLPLQAMRNIIQSGGGSITQLVSEAQKRVTGALHKKASALALDADDPEQTDGVEKRGTFPASLREYREWVANTQRTVDEWQRRVDDRIRNVVEGISPFGGLQKDVRELGARLAELESKLAQLASEEAAAKGDE
jgi:polyhydroxyalkanoate synthesis repressor PhaR